MPKICELFYSNNLELKKSNWLFFNKKYSDRKIDKEALDWLKIEENEICQSCCNHLQRITERLTQSFLRPYNVMLPLKKVVHYDELPREVKIIGWIAFLQDHLREHTQGHYFKVRFNKYRSLQ